MPLVVNVSRNPVELKERERAVAFVVEEAARSVAVTEEPRNLAEGVDAAREAAADAHLHAEVFERPSGRGEGLAVAGGLAGRGARIGVADGEPRVVDVEAEASAPPERAEDVARARAGDEGPASAVSA